jgi:hypothetical protein
VTRYIAGGLVHFFRFCAPFHAGIIAYARLAMQHAGRYNQRTRVVRRAG